MKQGRKHIGLAVEVQFLVCWSR